MDLDSFIKYLTETNPQLLIGVKHGRKIKWVKQAFAHSDRANYADLAITLDIAEDGFITKCFTTGELLQNLVSIRDTVEEGYKGGDFLMHGGVSVSITTDPSVCGVEFALKKTKQALLFFDYPFLPIKEMFFRK